MEDSTRAAGLGDCTFLHAIFLKRSKIDTSQNVKVSFATKLGERRARGLMFKNAGLIRRFVEENALLSGALGKSQRRSGRTLTFSLVRSSLKRGVP